VLTVDDIAVSYGAVRAVQGISLTLARGEIVALVGPNGAGKTSAVRAIAGLTTTRTGRITLDGRDITRLSADRVVRLGLVLVPEGRMIFGSLTVRENLLMGGYTREDRGALEEDLDRIGRRFPVLVQLAGEFASRLSGGERQLLAIGRALMGRPTMMIIDEPSHGLAPLAVRNVFRLVTELNQGGMGILLVEQNARQSLRIAHRAYVMQAGQIVLSGEAAKLRREESVVRAYLGVKNVEADEPSPSTAMRGHR
jgi:branched-chain amino acid transport system ATP-binding protein